MKATIPLPGGGTAVYDASGFSFFRHKDHLGSSVLATTWEHSTYSKSSYAPFGESYNDSVPTSGTTPDHSFTEQDQDTVSGLYDFMYRKYNPVAGRWTSLARPGGMGRRQFRESAELESVCVCAE